VRTFVSERSERSADRELAGEEKELLTPHPRIGVPVPAYRGRSLGNLPSSVWAALATSQVSEPPPLPPLETTFDPFHGRRPDGPVVILLLDGLGWLALRGSASRVPGGPAARWLRHGRAITSVFPTTTTVALTSLSTGAAPAQHGVLGHRVYLPHFGTVVELLRMSPLGVGPAESLVGPEWSPSMVSAVPSIYRRGVPAVALSRDRFEGTGFTRLIYDGATYAPYATGSDLALTLSEVLSRPDPPPLLMAYRDDLDVVQHQRGTRPELVDLEIERVDSLLSFVARHLDRDLVRRTKVIVTGDHGQVPMAAEEQLVVDREPAILLHLSRPPSGDRRSAFFTARPGHLAPLREELEGRLAPGGHLIDMPVATEAGLFGPPPFHPEIIERLGDLLLLSPSPGGVSYTAPGVRSRPHRMIAAHGGLEPEELLVPLVSGTLEELASDSSRTPHQSTESHPRARA
jgi:type I phosphodiesterase/nucleotide pyrophosphatase